MIERTALLGAKTNAARGLNGKRGPHIAARHPVRGRRREPRGIAHQPLLRRQHSARRKALVAASITPERDDRIVVAHRGNDPLELLLSVAMAMREFREIAMGERSEEHTSELQSLMRISYAVFCLNKKKTT